MPDAFYVADGDGFASTELTRGPWDPDSQHAGPPAALLGHAIEGLADASDFHVGRITIDILGAVPIGRLRASAEIVRPGRRVQLVEARLATDEGEVMRAAAWRIRRSVVDIPEELLQRDPPPEPSLGADAPFFPTGHSVGYHSAMEYRFLQGAYLEPGPATVWMRMRGPLVQGEAVSPLQRVLTAADSGNGVSATLEYRTHLFINVDLSVHLERMPRGEWVGLDSVTLPGAEGVGTADTLLFDEEGRIGRALQTLLIARRED